ncbi:MAG: hypothetical protein ACFCU8_01775 [Thermosynechococcaceae cyanobacterium]
MSIIKKTGSITALLACFSYGSVNSVYAAQLNFRDPFQGESTAQPAAPAAVDSELCEEEPAPKSNLNSLNLGPNLVASAVASDTPLGLQGRTLIAQAPICDLGGVAPEGGASLGSAFPVLPLLGALAGAGGIAAIAAAGGGDNGTPVVPEPAELATASLFASLGVAGVLLRRRKKSNEDA